MYQGFGPKVLENMIKIILQCTDRLLNLAPACKLAWRDEGKHVGP